MTASVISLIASVLLHSILAIPALRARLVTQRSLKIRFDTPLLIGLLVTSSPTVWLLASGHARLFDAGPLALAL